MEVFRLYLKFVASSHNTATGEGAQALKQAYEFALGRIGEDYYSGNLWKEYLAFLRQVSPALLHPGSAAPAAEAQRVADVRAAYQRALTVPTGALDGIWQEYERFEEMVRDSRVQSFSNHSDCVSSV